MLVYKCLVQNIIPNKRRLLPPLKNIARQTVPSHRRSCVYPSPTLYSQGFFINVQMNPAVDWRGHSFCPSYQTMSQQYSQQLPSPLPTSPCVYQVRWVHAQFFLEALLKCSSCKVPKEQRKDGDTMLCSKVPWDGLLY